MARIGIKDINERSSANEVLAVQDKLTRERIDAGMSPAAASKRTWEEIRDRTGQEWKKQSKVRVD